MKPKTFVSLVQKYRRCVRSFDELGEAILLVTKELYKKYEALFAAREEVDAEDPVQTEEVEDELQERRGPVDRMFHLLPAHYFKIAVRRSLWVQ
jgi:hypothetical protein